MPGTDYNKPKVPVRDRTSVENLPGNSISQRGSGRQVSASTNPNVQQPGSEPLGKKLLHSFFKSTPKEVGEHLLFNTIIPGVLKTVSDAGKGAIDGVLYGTGRVQQSSQHTDYAGYSSAPKINRVSGNGPRHQNAGNLGDRIWVNDILYQSPEDAQYVLDRLVDHIQTYGSVTISAVYDFSSMASQDRSTYHNWGWSALGQAKVIPCPNVADRWVINLPPPRLLG